MKTHWTDAAIERPLGFDAVQNLPPLFVAKKRILDYWRKRFSAHVEEFWNSIFSANGLPVVIADIPLDEAMTQFWVGVVKSMFTLEQEIQIILAGQQQVSECWP